MLFRMLLVGLSLGILTSLCACEKSKPEESPDVTVSEPESVPEEDNLMSEEAVEENATEEGLPDQGQVCDFHKYVIYPGETLVLPFTVQLGFQDPFLPSFSITKNEAESRGLEFYVTGVDSTYATFPVWMIDASNYLTFAIPIYQTSKGYSITWGTDSMGLVSLNNIGILKTGQLPQEEVLNNIKDVTNQVSSPASESGQAAQSARVPIELVQREKDIYFATVSVEVSVPDSLEDSINARIYFKGDPTGEFMLTAFRMGKSGAVQIIGPDHRPECYE